MSLLIKYPLYNTEGGGGAVTETESAKSLEETIFEGIDDADEVLELPEQPKKQAIKDADPGDETEVEEEATLEDELEEELAEPDEKKLDLMEAPRRAQILKDFPELFKKYPYLEHAYYRDQKYTEIFPTPRDAQEAQDKATALDNFETAVMDGQLGKVFESVRNSDQNAFYKMVDNLMVDLGKIDEAAQVHVITNVGKHLVQRMLEESQNQGQEVLKHAAIIFNQFLTGSSAVQPSTKLAKDEPKQDDTVLQERHQFLQERHTVTREDIITKLDGKITATLNKKLDPNDSMSEFVRDAAINKAKREVQSLISKDTRFNTLMKQAWTRALRSNYSRGDVDYIRQQYENKAASLLPSIINKVRSQALKGLAKRTNGSSESDEQVEIREPNKRGPVAPGRSAAPTNSGSKDARELARAIPKAKSTRDFLMED